MSKADKIKTLLREKELLIGIGAGNALEARIIENADFDFIWASGFVISASYALPDASLITMTQILDAGRSMSQAVDLPIIADCDTGFGNAINVIHATKLFESGGMAGICIEDKLFPKATSLLVGAKQQLLPTQEFVGKIHAAVDARQNGNFLIIARTEALIAGLGVEEALERGRLYAQAGADSILIHSKSNTPNEISDFINGWDHPTPLVIIPTAYPSLTEEMIQNLGKVKMVIYANQLLRAAIRSQENLLQEIKHAGGIHTIDELMCSVKHVFDLQGVGRMKKYETKYL